MNVSPLSLLPLQDNVCCNLRWYPGIILCSADTCVTYRAGRRCRPPDHCRSIARICKHESLDYIHTSHISRTQSQASKLCKVISIHGCMVNKHTQTWVYCSNIPNNVCVYLCLYICMHTYNDMCMGACTCKHACTRACSCLYMTRYRKRSFVRTRHRSWCRLCTFLRPG